ncbi:hypothetical protein EVA_06510 [gut metagenome]|uniref:DUF3127 domain-containing protein n=1 Tax=gut metagenome TaxID=749906 RepID=J9GS13_9ZZZZ
MEISGKIIAALEPRGGVSQRTGNTWKMQEFVIETHEQYPKHCVFTIFGEDKLRDFNIQVGEELTVSFDIDAHEYQGRWFNDIRAWRVQRGVVDPNASVAGFSAAAAAPTAAPAQAAIPSPSVAASEGTADDLPF